jgi:hypothetical protein
MRGGVSQGLVVAPTGVRRQQSLLRQATSVPGVHSPDGAVEAVIAGHGLKRHSIATGDCGRSSSSRPSRLSVSATEDLMDQLFHAGFPWHGANFVTDMTLV